MKKPNNIVRIPCSLQDSFFKYWFMFLEPLHKLTNKEIDVMALFIKHRYILSKDILSEEILDKVTLGEEVKRKIREELEMNFSHFQVIMVNLRKKGAIKDGRINPKFIPNVIEDNNSFQLLLHFDFKDNV